MEIFKKLLVLSMMPASVLAMENENKEGRPLLRKPLNHQNLNIQSFYSDWGYYKNIPEALNKLKIKQMFTADKIESKDRIERSQLLKLRHIDLTDLELTIIKQEQKERKVHDDKMADLSRKLSEVENKNIELNKQNIELHNNINHFKNHIPKVRARSFAFGALATCLYYIWYPLFTRAK